MSMLARLIAASILLLPLSSLALGQWPKECRNDVARTCHEASQQGDRATLGCLQSNEKTIKRACRKLLERFGYVDSPGSRRPADVTTGQGAGRDGSSEGKGK